MNYAHLSSTVGMDRPVLELYIVLVSKLSGTVKDSVSASLEVHFLSSAPYTFSRSDFSL